MLRISFAEGLTFGQVRFCWLQVGRLVHEIPPGGGEVRVVPIRQFEPFHGSRQGGITIPAGTPEQRA